MTAVLLFLLNGPAHAQQPEDPSPPASEDASDEPDNKGLSGDFQAGMPVLKSDKTALNFDASLAYDWARWGLSSHFGADNSAVGSGSSFATYNQSSFDLQLRYRRHADPTRWQLRGRGELAYQSVGSVAIGQAQADSDFVNIAAFSAALGARAPDGDWTGAAWGRISYNNELRINISGFDAGATSANSVGFSGLGVLERKLGPLSITSASSARSLRVRRTDILSGELQAVQLITLRETATVWLNSLSFIGLRPGAYGSLNASAAGGPVALTPSFGLQFVADPAEILAF